MLGPARLEARLGLTSVLLLRERRPGLVRIADEDAAARAGEVSREDNGEFVVEGEADTLSERPPLREVWCRMEPGIAAGADGLLERDG